MTSIVDRADRSFGEEIRMIAEKRISQWFAVKRVLKPYGRPPPSGWRWLINATLLASFSFFCLIYGFGFALTAPYLIVPFATPIAVLAMIAIWALPAARTAPDRTLEALFFAFLTALVIWPNYLAIALPGMPWVTMQRLTGIPLVLTLLICVSSSAEFRARTAQALSAAPLLWKLLVGFACIQLLSVFLSDDPGQSLSKFFVAQMNWSAIFFVSCYVFLKPGRVIRWATVLCILAVLIGLLAAWEAAARQVLWNGHVPEFLKVEEAASRLEASMRKATAIYRVKATFTTALGLGEFIALALPFIVHFGMGTRRWIVRFAASAAIGLLLYVVTTTDSRLAVIGAFLSILLYFLFWSILRWLRNKGDLFGPAIVFSYPFLFVTAIAATFFVTKLRRMVWGGGAQQASNAGREAQVDAGLPLIMKNPLGYGIGQGAETLGYRGAADMLTIDNYYLSVALEYGVMGFLVFYGMLLVGIINAGRYALKFDNTSHTDVGFFVPISVALTNFFVIKSVFSQQDMHPLVFMMLGMLVALMHRANTEQPDKPATH